jgi:hypothetical protein
MLLSNNTPVFFYQLPINMYESVIDVEDGKVIYYEMLSNKCVSQNVRAC